MDTATAPIGSVPADSTHIGGTPLPLAPELVRPNADPVPMYRAEEVAKQVALVQIRTLIIAFEEVEGYDVHLHHNKRPPALWVDDGRYMQDVKALLHELRRLNYLLESATEPDQATVDETGGAIAHAAKKMSDGAYDTIGKGLGYVILVSIGTILYQLGIGGDLGQAIISSIRGK